MLFARSPTCATNAVQENTPSHLAFQPDYAGGIKILKSIRPMLAEECSITGADIKLSAAIAFPEMTRYNMVKDLVETKTLEAAYIKGGVEAADFSIGCFQMKPSFIEYLESQLPALAVPKGKTIASERTIRLQRLKSARWQCRYLAHFTNFASKKYSRHDTGFLAAAYNLGPMRDATSIESWMPVEAFPFGVKFKGKQIAYAKIAEVFIKEYADKLF